MTTPAQMSAAQRSYEARLEREFEKLLAEDDKENYCSGDCETCDVPFCNISNKNGEQS